MNGKALAPRSKTEMAAATVVVLAAAVLTPLLPWAPMVVSAAVAGGAWVRYRRTRHVGWLLIGVGAAAVAAAGLLLNLGWFLVSDSQTGTNVDPASPAR